MKTRRWKRGGVASSGAQSTEWSCGQAGCRTGCKDQNGQAHGFEHAALIRLARTCNIKGRSMVDRCANYRQADRDVLDIPIPISGPSTDHGPDRGTSPLPGQSRRAGRGKITCPLANPTTLSPWPGRPQSPEQSCCPLLASRSLPIRLHAD